MSDTQPLDSAGSRSGAPFIAETPSAIIRSVRTVLGFLTLIVVFTVAALWILGRGASPEFLFGTTVALFLALAVLVVGVAVRWPSALGLAAPAAASPGSASSDPLVDTATIEQRLDKSPKIVGEEAPPLSGNVWYEDLRPVLHQAIHYTSPTYYLDTNLMLVDWNLAFELVFSRSLARIRSKHVKHFIAELANYEEVIDHAQKFTRRVFKGEIPFVDVEPIRYGSERYGEVRFVKVAAQLHDPEGRPRGWSVSLLIRDIDWEAFQRDLLEESRKDKLWSVYSASYDHVLLEFPPYKQLIDDVIDVVPHGRRSVADLGAGTGNVTAALLAVGHSVTAVESNLAMLDRLRSKRLAPKSLSVVKSSAENLGGLPDASFDAAVMVNVLYAVNDPLTCLQHVHRILRPRGVLGLSTTHAETDLDPLLGSIKARLEEIGKYDALAGDYKLVFDINKAIEKGIAKRHTREEYREWIRTAGFEIVKDVPSTYEDAVMLIHARKV